MSELGEIQLEVEALVAIGFVEDAATRPAELGDLLELLDAFPTIVRTAVLSLEDRGLLDRERAGVEAWRVSAAGSAVAFELGIPDPEAAPA